MTVPVHPGWPCRICGVAVHGPNDGVAFRAGKVKFAACHQHAPMVRRGGLVVGELVKKATRAFFANKFPFILEAYDEVAAQETDVR